MSGRFELYRDLRERFRFRLKAEDGTIILSSDGFEQKAAALGAIVSIMKSVQEASIVDLTGSDARRYGDEPEDSDEEASDGEEAYGYDEYDAYAAFDAGSHGAGRGKKEKRKKKKRKKERKGKGRRSRGGDRDDRKGGKGRRKKKK